MWETYLDYIYLDSRQGSPSKLLELPCSRKDRHTRLAEGVLSDVFLYSGITWYHILVDTERESNF